MILAVALAALFHGTSAFAAPIEVPLASQEESSVLVAISVRTPELEPLADAKIRLVWDPPGKPRRVLTGLTNDAGALEILVPRGAHFEWSAEAPGSGQKKKGTSTAPKDRDSTELQILLHTTDDATYSAVFVDAESGKPVPGVLLELFPSKDRYATRKALSPPKAPSAVSDRDGRAEVPAATWRTSHLYAYADGYAYVYIAIGSEEDAPGFREPERLTLQKEASFLVTLIDGADDLRVAARSNIDTKANRARRLPARSLQISSFLSTPTGEDGRHLIRGLMPGSSTTLRLLRGSQELRVLGTLKCGGPGSVLKEVYDCWQRGVIRGTLQVAEGSARGGRVVRLSETGQRPGLAAIGVRGNSATTVTDVEGYFRFDGLAVGKYRLTLRPQEDDLALEAQVCAPVSVSITSDMPNADADLVELTGLYVSGTLVDANAVPQADSVYAQSKSGRSKAQCDREGRFRIGPFLPGEQVSLWSSPKESRWTMTRSPTQAATAPANNVVIVLGSAGKIEGSVKGLPPRVQYRDLQIDLRGDSNGYSYGSGTVKKDGSFSMGQLKPGKYKLTVSLDSSYKSSPLDVEVVADKITGGLQLELPPRRP